MPTMVGMIRNWFNYIVGGNPPETQGNPLVKNKWVSKEKILYFFLNIVFPKKTMNPCPGDDDLTGKINRRQTQQKDGRGGCLTAK